MSIRNITVQYVGNVLLLPKLERDVKLVVERNYETADPDKRFVMEQSESNRESRWYKLFGTPERAAETLKRMDVDACNWCVNSSGNPEDCRACPYKYDYYGCYLPEKFSMLEWLKSEVVE